MNKVFFDYSKYYDLIYKDKNYKSEAEFIMNLIKAYHPKAKTILNLGCGTGNHDFILAQNGFEIIGVDLSENMISIAKEKNTSDKCTFLHGDARGLKIDKQFDVIISLFHVFSYQNTNQDAIEFLKTIQKYLKPRGIAIFDYWYGPAVLNIRPEIRIKRIESSDLSIERHASTDLDEKNNIATVNFDISIKDKLTLTESKLREKHPMRYFFSDEVKEMIGQAHLVQLQESEWMKASAPNKDTWAAYSVVGNR